MLYFFNAILVLLELRKWAPVSATAGETYGKARASTDSIEARGLTPYATRTKHDTHMLGWSHGYRPGPLAQMHKLDSQAPMCQDGRQAARRRAPAAVLHCPE
eukprot:COSAG01_NODE_295_length_19292_cov_726.304538_6_plen_102_part_00